MKNVKMLQQYLPFTVLKLLQLLEIKQVFVVGLQQYLPFTVLKRFRYDSVNEPYWASCNSAYRLRYWIEYYDKNPE